MTWPLAACVIATLALVGAMTWVVLPYVRRKSDHETRLAALEAANVELTHNMAVVQQAFGGGLPGMPKVRAVSR